MSDVFDLTDSNGKPLKKSQDESGKQIEVHTDYKERYMRALADYKNLQRQMNDERKLIFDIATAGVLEQLLPTLDHLYQAEIFIKDVGLKLVREQFEMAVKSLGLEEIDLKGRDFDPHLAEVVDTVDGEQANKVAEVVKKGYKLGDKVIRVAQVKVTRKAAEAGHSEE